MDTIPQETSPAFAARQLLKRLQAEFSVFQEHQPLAIGIDKQVLLRLPEVDRKTLRMALAMHTRSLRYLKMSVRSSSRVDLDGKPTGEILPAHRERAAEILKERLSKQVEQRKAQREAEALAQKRSQKLQQLMEKFGRKQ